MSPVASCLQGVKQQLVKNPDFLVKHKTFMIHPPDAIAAQRLTNPSDFYLPRVLLYLPFDLKDGCFARCPHCMSTNVTRDGYSQYRRVIDVEDFLFVITRRYECQAGHSKNRYFAAWDLRLLEASPPQTRLAFPVMLTHRLGVTQHVADALRTMVVNGMTIEAFTKYMRECHTRAHHRRELAYLSRLADAMENKDEQTTMISFGVARVAEAPAFSTFADPLGYNGCYGTSGCYGDLYLRVMQTVEPSIRRRSSMVPARMLSGDHFFKILKRNFTFARKKLFQAAYSLVNEHSEVMSILLTQTKTLGELRTMLEGVQRRMVALGLPANHVQAFFTDNPSAEANFLEGIYPGLSRTQPAATHARSSTGAMLPLLDLPAGHVLDYTAATQEAERLLTIFRHRLDAEKGRAVIGLDAEWSLRGGVGRGGGSGRAGGLQGGGAGRVDVLQMSCSTHTLVLHLSLMASVPPQVKTIMSDVNIIKVGKNIGADKARLATAYGIKCVHTLELGRLARERQLVQSGCVSLASMVEIFLQATLDKAERLRLSEWGKPLDEEQKKYALLDAYASLAVFRSIMAAGSSTPAPDARLEGLDMYVVGSNGARRVARCRVAATQSPKHGNFIVGGRGRVWVQIADALVPGFVLPFTVRREPSTLDALVADAKRRGLPPVVVVSRLHLRDADHLVERRLSEQKQTGGGAIGALIDGDGEFDALPGLEASVRPMCDSGRCPQAAGGGGDAAPDDKEDNAADSEAGRKSSDKVSLSPPTSDDKADTSIGPVQLDDVERGRR